MEDLSDFEASVLKEIIPDIGALVLDDGIRSIPPDHQRLVQTIVDVFCKQNYPILLIVEDLQWSTESLDVLRALALVAPELPLLIVGSYRDDERPHLPSELPKMEVIKLKRLASEDVAELSVSMLGEIGKEPEVIDLLQRETEGNAFFLVEVVRALAEKAGSLNDIGRIQLPERVFSGGIQDAARQRLSHAPESVRPLLKWAAIIGRQIDTALLAAITKASAQTLQDWIIDCSEAAIFEIHEGRWRFAHDKLCECVIADLSDEERPVLYRQVAEAVEMVYPDDVLWVTTLAHLWHVAGNKDKEARYAYLSAKEAYRVGFTRDAQVWGERVISITSDIPAELKINTFSLLGNAYINLGDYGQAIHYYGEQLALAREADDITNTAKALSALGYVSTQQGKLTHAQQLLQEALYLAQKAGNREQIANIFNNLGMTTWLAGDLEKASEYHHRGLLLWQEEANAMGISRSYNNLGVIAIYLEKFEDAKEYLNKSLAIKYTLDDRTGIASTLLNLARLNLKKKDFAVAQKYCEESLAVCRITGEQWGVVKALATLINACLGQGKIDDVFAYFIEAFATALNIRVMPQLAHIIAVYTRLCVLQEKLNTGAELLGLVLHHTSTPSYVIEECQQEIYPLFAERIGEVVLKQSIERGRTFDLETTAKQILSEIAQ